MQLELMQEETLSRLVPDEEPCMWRLLVVAPLGSLKPYKLTQTAAFALSSFAAPDLDTALLYCTAVLKVPLNQINY